MNEDAVLCYVREPWAYFTTKPLSTQWGDDWNDAPYEYNAGVPYTGEGWEVFRIAYEGNLTEPWNGHLNSPYSVVDINLGVVPWLVGMGPSDHATVVNIFAGTTYSEFMRLVSLVGGKIYVPLDVSAHNME